MYENEVNCSELIGGSVVFIHAVFRKFCPGSKLSATITILFQNAYINKLGYVSKIMIITGNKTKKIFLFIF